MVENFLKLCKGLPDGRGYQGSKLFRAKPNDHVLGGDFENNDGTGGASAYDEKYLIAEQVTEGEKNVKKRQKRVWFFLLYNYCI